MGLVGQVMCEVDMTSLFCTNTLLVAIVKN